jgi:hypothetical protein
MNAPDLIGRVDPTPLGFVDHAPFSGLGVRLVYGLTADDVLVHVSQVASGLACACTCPACGRRLRAHRGKIRVDHFVHHDEGAACGVGAETNAHYWAKGILEREKRIRLPAVDAQSGKASLTLFRSDFFEFDEVRVEQRMGQIVPDLILRKGERQLIVEVFVTHRCGPEKIEKIRAANTSALEVDLSAYRRCADEATIARAFLDTAKRTWLYNPRQAKAAAVLHDRIKAEEAEAEARAERQMRRGVETVRKARGVVTEPMSAHHAALDLLLRDHCRRVPTPDVDGFIVPAEYWQTEIYWQAVFLPTRSGAARDMVDALGVLDQVEHCLAPALRGPGSHALRTRALAVSPPYRPPVQAVEVYLEALQEFGVLTYDRRTGGLIISAWEQEHVRKRLRAMRTEDDRERQTLARVGAILDRLPAEDREGFDLEAWLGRATEDVSPRALWSDPDEAAWQGFLEDLGKIDRTLDGTRAVEDLLGLPYLDQARRVEQAQRDAAAARARAAEEKRVQDAQDRLVNLSNRAAIVLGAGAKDWLNQMDPATGQTPALLALGGVEGLWKAQSRLDLIEQAQAAEAARRRQADECFARLRQAALKVYDEERAELFLNSAHPKLGGLTPRARCGDALGLALCQALLRQKRR